MTRNCSISERVPHEENIIPNSIIPERVPHAIKYNTKFHNTRGRFTCRNIIHKITQYQSVFHMQKNIIRDSTIPERILHIEKYNTESQNTIMCYNKKSTFNKYYTKYESKDHFIQDNIQHEKYNMNKSR